MARGIVMKVRQARMVVNMWALNLIKRMNYKHHPPNERKDGVRVLTKESNIILPSHRHKPNKTRALGKYASFLSSGC